MLFGAIDFGNMSFNHAVQLQDTSPYLFIFYEDWDVDIGDSSICSYLWQAVVSILFF